VRKNLPRFLFAALAAFSNCTLVDEADLPFEGRTWQYDLYQRKEETGSSGQTVEPALLFY